MNIIFAEKLKRSSFVNKSPSIVHVLTECHQPLDNVTNIVKAHAYIQQVYYADIYTLLMGKWRQIVAAICPTSVLSAHVRSYKVSLSLSGETNANYFINMPVGNEI